MSRLGLTFAIVLSAAVLAGCASDGGISTSPDRAVTPTANLGAPDPLTSSAIVEKDYRIGPLDLLDVSVFQVEDLTRSVQVDASGQILLPLIGKVQAAGETTSELSNRIAGRLEAHYMQSPQVTVFVKQAQSQKVTVAGAVAQAGVFPLTGRTTLLQVMAMAKGADQYADIGHVLILRQVNNQRMATVFNLKGIQTGRYADPEVFGNDVVVVNPSAGKKLFYNIIMSTPLLALFHVY